MKIDIPNTRYFINPKGEKSVGVYSLTDHSFIRYISFPDEEWKSIVSNDSFIIFASAAQINVHTI